jgi:hypothetical protein
MPRTRAFIGVRGLTAGQYVPAGAQLCWPEGNRGNLSKVSAASERELKSTRLSGQWQMPPAVPSRSRSNSSYRCTMQLRWTRVVELKNRGSQCTRPPGYQTNQPGSIVCPTGAKYIGLVVSQYECGEKLMSTHVNALTFAFDACPLLRQRASQIGDRMVLPRTAPVTTPKQTRRSRGVLGASQICADLGSCGTVAPGNADLGPSRAGMRRFRGSPPAGAEQR